MWRCALVAPRAAPRMGTHVGARYTDGVMATDGDGRMTGRQDQQARGRRHASDGHQHPRSRRLAHAGRSRPLEPLPEVGLARGYRTAGRPTARLVWGDVRPRPAWLHGTAQMVRPPCVRVGCSLPQRVALRHQRLGSLALSPGDEGDYYAGVYLDMLANREAVRRMFAFMASVSEDGCVLFHCSAGMDRTGVTAMLSRVSRRGVAR